jgi:hypothetical protein
LTGFGRLAVSRHKVSQKDEESGGAIVATTSSHLKSEASLKVPAVSNNSVKTNGKTSNKKLKKISLDVDNIKMNIANAIGHKK